MQVQTYKNSRGWCHIQKVVIFFGILSTDHSGEALEACIFVVLPIHCTTCNGRCPL
jgi:hypothetical protein